MIYCWRVCRGDIVACESTQGKPDCWRGNACRGGDSRHAIQRMEEVRQLVQEEGREARNLVAFHVAVDTPANRVARKPPRSINPVTRRVTPRAPAARLRSASRWKRQEVGEIYNTVEAHENLSECQEVILVLENYTRDFKALGEWFRLKWEYDNTPPPQRPQSLAWEIRKTDFVRPESRRAHSVRSSPSVSGKNSPCYSGYNTPSGKNSPSHMTGKASPGSGKISPRISSGHSNTSPKGSVEFFSNKISINSKNTKTEPKSIDDVTKECTKLSDIKEKPSIDVLENNIQEEATSQVENEITEAQNKFQGQSESVTIEIGTAKECPAVAYPKQVVLVKSSKQIETIAKESPEKTKVSILSTQAKATIAMMDAMETDFINRQTLNVQIKNDNALNENFENDHKLQVPVSINECNESNSNVNNSVTNEESNEKAKEPSEIDEMKIIDLQLITDNSEIEKESNEVNKDLTENLLTLEKEKELDVNGNREEIEEVDPLKSDQKTETKLVTKPAYSQAAAKPKQISQIAKVEVKPHYKTMNFARSKTVVEISHPNLATKTQKQFPKRSQTNKCSYPFNLTTSRTTLFDSTTSKCTFPRKPLSRASINQTSGDNIKIKQDLKKPLIKRPTSLNISEKLDKTEEKKNPQLENIKDCDEYGSSDTIVAQVDMSRIESSESLKTLVPEDTQFLDDIASSIEVLNLDGDSNDNDGWLTVKSKRLNRESKKQSKSYWANRYRQPSATTSLPTLNMMESPKQETKEITDSLELPNTDRAKSEQPQRPEKSVKVKVTDNKKSINKYLKNSTGILRQKSDVTGLKTRSARNKAMIKKNDKQKDAQKNGEDDSELLINRLHSSLESLTTGLSRSQESTENTFDFDKWKADFKSTFKYLEDEDQIPSDNELLKTADPSEMSEIAEMTSQIEENERKMSLALDFQSELDQKKLCEEEDLLNRQIRELQQVSDIDIDTETDDTETDAEILCEDTQNREVLCPTPENLGSLAASLEDQYEPALAGLSWAERVDTLATLEELVARYPGRAQQLHVKLSQGIRRRGSLQEILKRYQVKQARAEQQRLELQTERTKKIQQLLARVEEVKVAKSQLTEEKRLRMERRLQKAAENRDQHLKDIVRKAHDEEEKLREIAFIKQLEAEHRRHDFLDQCRSHTARLRQMRRDRLTKLEQKAAREAAVGARRMAIEAARKLHVENLLEKRKERDARVEELKEQKKQERDDAAREKAEGVKSRLSALAAAAELEADALRSRIRDKQDASQQRLATHLQAIRTKATAPRQQTTSESQDTQSTKESTPEETEKSEQGVTKEKLKAMRKKTRKLRQKLLSAGQEFEEVNTPTDALTVSFPFNMNHKLFKALNQLNSIIMPLVPPELKNDKKDINENGVDDHGTLKERRGMCGRIANGLGKCCVSDRCIERHNNEKNKLMSETETKGKSKRKASRKSQGEYRNNDDEAKGQKRGDDAKVTNNNDIAPKAENDSENSKGNDKKKESETESETGNEGNTQGGDVKQNKENNKVEGKFNNTDSVCSSTSDVSKVSAKSEATMAKVTIDLPLLERTLNEFHRSIDKLDKNIPEKMVHQKIHGLRLLGHLLSFTMDREDVAAQVPTRTLVNTVVVISRLIGACALSAAYFISTNGCVHVARLLINELLLGYVGLMTVKTVQSGLSAGNLILLIHRWAEAIEIKGEALGFSLDIVKASNRV
ncbi:S phase cyclin A-associated protein in the endoplasmic reticulum [Eumeta japonica]|uniref:S phase cyclin A-associated protein in the endoplasmic reticulum n=1 Tax=Eumeta variegata TaxID=151549 RepID=A0A4C1SN49_EUMVA|nr:S phase cyclin A-associated protein in the endoplasmic reticulum [Eumeta japonica]